MIISVVVFRFNTTSVAAVGVLLGAVFLVAGFDEFMIASVRSSWAWAHIVLGVLFVFGAVWSFASPFNAFWSLASVLGLLLVLMGALGIVQSIASRDLNDLWGLSLAAGILEVLLGFWTSQQAFPAQGAMLLLLVGFLALFLGFREMVIAFELRSVRPE
jgi:uncharacterized membrane protein HdeD (DUF308 family)